MGDRPSAGLPEAENINLDRALAAFRSRCDTLNTLLSSSVIQIASQLYSRSLILPADMEAARNNTQLASVRTIQLLDTVETRIRAEPQSFIEFVRIIESQPALTTQAAELVRAYDNRSRREQSPITRSRSAANKGSQSKPRQAVTDGESDIDFEDGGEDGEPESADYRLPLSCFKWAIKKNDSRSSGKKLIQGPTPKLWQRKTLMVYFFNLPKGILYGPHSDALTKSQVIDWMNEWRVEGSSVPRFEETGTKKQSDIRVEFIYKGFSETSVGTDAIDDGIDEPTMTLNLCYTTDTKKKYEVLHETGHALGFEHEHQGIVGLFNRRVVIEDLKSHPNITSEEEAEKAYEENFEAVTQGTTLDKDSIMKYPIKKTWIAKGHMDFFKGNYLDKKDKLWPRSSLTGELTDLDKKLANEKYELVMKGRVQPDNDDIPDGLRNRKKGHMQLDNGNPDDGLHNLREGRNNLFYFIKVGIVAAGLLGILTISIWLIIGSESEFTFNNVMSVLADLSPDKIDNLALELGLSFTDMERIEQDHPKDVDRVLKKVIDFWMKNIAKPKPSWQVLKKALEKVQPNLH